jgi:hypothetical protein
MNVRILVATLGGAVLNFLLGWLVYGILLMDFFTNNMTHYDGLMKEMPNVFLIFLANLFMAFLYAFIFDRWANIRTFAKGFVGGIIISSMISISMDLYFLSSMNLYNGTSVVVDILVAILFGGIVGGLIGWILGYGGRENKTEAA